MSVLSRPAQRRQAPQAPFHPGSTDIAITRRALLRSVRRVLQTGIVPIGALPPSYLRPALYAQGNSGAADPEATSDLTRSWQRCGRNSSDIGQRVVAQIGEVPFLTSQHSVLSLFPSGPARDIMDLWGMCVRFIRGKAIGTLPDRNTAMSAITRARFLRGEWEAPPVSPSPDALARISGLCVAFKAVHCRSCLEACEVEAIRFLPRIGGISTPTIVDRDCTGCGECRDICPARAITLVSRNGETQ